MVIRYKKSMMEFIEFCYFSPNLSVTSVLGIYSEKIKFPVSVFGETLVRQMLTVKTARNLAKLVLVALALPTKLSHTSQQRESREKEERFSIQRFPAKSSKERCKRQRDEYKQLAAYVWAETQF